MHFCMPRDGPQKARMRGTATKRIGKRILSGAVTKQTAFCGPPKAARNRLICFVATARRVDSDPALADCSSHLSRFRAVAGHEKVHNTLWYAASSASLVHRTMSSPLSRESSLISKRVRPSSSRGRLHGSAGDKSLELAGNAGRITRHPRQAVHGADPARQSKGIPTRLSAQ